MRRRSGVDRESRLHRAGTRDRIHLHESHASGTKRRFATDLHHAVLPSEERQGQTHDPDTNKNVISGPGLRHFARPTYTAHTKIVRHQTSNPFNKMRSPLPAYSPCSSLQISMRWCGVAAEWQVDDFNSAPCAMTGLHLPTLYKYTGTQHRARRLVFRSARRRSIHSRQFGICEYMDMCTSHR